MNNRPRTVLFLPAVLSCCVLAVACSSPSTSPVAAGSPSTIATTAAPEETVTVKPSQSASTAPQASTVLPMHTGEPIRVTDGQDCPTVDVSNAATPPDTSWVIPAMELTNQEHFRVWITDSMTSPLTQKWVMQDNVTGVKVARANVTNPGKLVCITDITVNGFTDPNPYTRGDEYSYQPYIRNTDGQWETACAVTVHPEDKDGTFFATRPCTVILSPDDVEDVTVVK